MPNRKLGIRQKEKLFNEFARLARNFLIEYLAVKDEKYSGEFKEVWELPTPAGILKVTLDFNPEYESPTIFQKFEDVDRALKSHYTNISRNGKWNFHYTVDDKNENMDLLIIDWKLQIQSLMKKPVVLPPERFEIFNLRDNQLLANRYESIDKAEEVLQDLLHDSHFQNTKYPQNRDQYDVRKSIHPCEKEKSLYGVWIGLTADGLKV